LKISFRLNVEELVPAIRTRRSGAPDEITGCRRKTAERMVVELKDKLEAVTIETRKAGSFLAGGR